MKETFGEFEKRRPAASVGVYSVEYSDSTHCQPDVWTKLLKIQVEGPPQPLVGSDESQSYYSATVAVDLTRSEEKNRERNGHAILDTLAQVFVRTGILRPKMTDDAIRDIFSLSRGRAVVVVPDTNALSTGTLHWLLEALSGTNVWLLPAVVSITQIQQRDAMLKSLVHKRKPSDSQLVQALRSRSLVNASLSLLERHRERYEVLEVDPQLLRYMRPAGANSSDPDQGDILEDRLLIEAIHAAIRSTRSRTQRRVVTSDVLLARIFRTEGIPTLFLQVPTLPTEPMPCIRYEPLARSFMGASLPRLLWELTHAFAGVRISSDTGPEPVTLSAYWPDKTADEWATEVLQVSPGLAKVGSTTALTEAKSTISTASAATASAPAEIIKNPISNDGVTAVRFSKSKLLEVAFPQVLRIANVLLAGAGTPEELRSRISEEQRPSLDITLQAAEMLLRCRLAIATDTKVEKTDLLTEFMDCLQNSDLDEASAILEGWAPYKALIDLLHILPGQKTEAVSTALLRKLQISGNLKGAARLCRISTYLGQSWTDDLRLRDGTNRPTVNTVRDELISKFNKHEKEGLCPVREFVPEACRTLRVTPWAIGRYVQRLLDEDAIRELSFQPSVGRIATAKDEVAGRNQEGDVIFIPVPPDRLQVNGRPVFVVSRGSE
jgi:hypothetical protein